MSFADDLKKMTKDKEQLEAQQRENEIKQHQQAVSWTIWYIEIACERAAKKGDHTASEYFRGGNPSSVMSEYLLSFGSKADALEYAEDVKKGLAADGLTDFRYKLEKQGFIGDKSYSVKYLVNW